MTVSSEAQGFSDLIDINVLHTCFACIGIPYNDRIIMIVPEILKCIFSRCRHWIMFTVCITDYIQSIIRGSTLHFHFNVVVVLTVAKGSGIEDIKHQLSGERHTDGSGIVHIVT